jgi:hypothetical protein
MATPADQRLLELLDKWLKSLELHAKYSSLDDDNYWKIQSWVEHQRPSRWIIDLAMQKTVALRAQVQERVDLGDAKFSDSLELLIFLANLVGSEHIERFIPMAEAQNERSLTPPPDEDATVSTSATTISTSAITATREMPKFLGTKRVAPPASNAHVARTERKTAVPARPAAKPAGKHPVKPAPSVKPAPAAKVPAKTAAKPVSAEPPERSATSNAVRAQVIADAARLVQWGRKWYELPELIARMADRPSLPEVRRILKENKSDIDEKARAPNR